MVLDSQQMSQLVQEVRESLLRDSQGVGDVERVTTLDYLVSLPALYLSGGTEKVVEAPLYLLSQPAVEAAADSRQATEDATVAATLAQAAADAANASLPGVESVTDLASKATAQASIGAALAQAAAVGAEGSSLYSLLLSAAMQDAISQADAATAALELRADHVAQLCLRMEDRLALAIRSEEQIRQTLLMYGQMQAEVMAAVGMAGAAATDTAAGNTRLTALLYECGRAFIDLRQSADEAIRAATAATLSMGAADLRVARLDMLEQQLLDMTTQHDTAASIARQAIDGILQAEEAAAQGLQLCREATDEAREAVWVVTEAELDCRSSATQADLAAYHASRATEDADRATEQALTAKADADTATAASIAATQQSVEATSDSRQATADARQATEAAWDARLQALHLPQIQDGTWWLWDVEQQQYVDSHQAVNSEFVLTRQKVEAVLTGYVTSHHHPAYVPQVYDEELDLASLVSYTDEQGEHTFVLGNEIYVADSKEPNGYALYRLSPTDDGQRWMRLPQAVPGYRFLLVKCE